MKLETNTGLVLEEVRSGFLGLPVIYYLWHGKRLIGHSTDKKNWVLPWVDKMGEKSEIQITPEMFAVMSKTGDV